MEPKCFECGETFAAEDGLVGDTYAFCCDDCRSSFMAGLGF
jgi:predicted  nucleic acid-binding Zn ribbon protein